MHPIQHFFSPSFSSGKIPPPTACEVSSSSTPIKGREEEASTNFPLLLLLPNTAVWRHCGFASRRELFPRREWWMMAEVVGRVREEECTTVKLGKKWGSGGGGGGST